MGPLFTTRTVRSTRSRSRRRSDRPVWFLAALPVIDPVINQINGIYPVSAGPLSLLQVVRGALLIGAMAMTIATSHGLMRPARAVRRVALAVGVCLCVFALNEALTAGGIVLGSLVAYSQIVYWLVMWSLAAASVTDARRAGIVMGGLVTGAILTAASVFYGYAVGVSTVYSAQGVAASAGWFSSGKGISGTLLAGALISAYLSRRRRGWVFTLITLLCLGASFVTYARAGMVALAVALCWLLFWTVKTRATSTSDWARRLMLGAACGVAAIVFTIGTTDLLERWSDVGNPDRAGSGRLVLWKAALNSFAEGDTTQQLIGRGYTGMVEAMYGAVGLLLHTHNDLLDMLGVGGLLGIAALVILTAGMIVQIRAVPIAAPGAALAVALLLVLWCHGFFTGQIFMPDIVTFYLLGISCALAHATNDDTALGPAGYNARPEPLRTRTLRRALAALPRT